MSKRLDALLSSAGNTRSEAKKLIKTKRIAVNGVIVNDIAARVEDGDTVTLDGQPVDTAEFVWLLLNKPAGWVSTTEDSPDCVLNLIPPPLRRRELAPAGRLDKESEGVLLLTDDGAFAHRVISPKREIDKLYYIETEKPVGDADIKAIAEGIELSGGEKCLPAVITPCPVRIDGSGANAAEIVIHEGKYHQVRRMLAACGNRVTRLIRLRVGPFTLEGVAPGEFRRLTEDEIALI